MSTSIERSTMENSNILRELADFDTTAPISVSISFEDDFDETPIKTEIDTNDYQENHKTTNTAFVPILEPKREIEADTITPCVLTEELTNEFTAHNFQDTSALQPASLRNQLSTSTTLRKRKTDVEMYNPKKNKTISDTTDQNNCDKEISLQTFASHTKENNIQAGPTLTTRENAKKSTDFDIGPTENYSDPNLDGNRLVQTDIDKLNAYLIKCLASLSENMRLIVQAFGAYIRQQISKEDFIKVKSLHFRSSYKTVLTMIVPEENNNVLKSTFLKDTLQRVRTKRSSFFMHTYQNYENLLHEMITWTKTQQQEIKKSNEKSKQPTPVPNRVMTEPQVNKNLAQDKRNNNIQLSNLNTERDKVCIFSSGPPERALSINIDPRLNKYLQITKQNAETIENYGDTTNYNKPTHQSVIQSTNPQIPNLLTNDPKQHSMLPLNTSSYSMSNYSIPSQQMRDQTPALRMQLEKAPLQSHLIQPVDSQRPPPRYGHSQHFAPQTQQPMPPTPYDQSRHLQTQPSPQQQIPPQYNQVPVLQTRSTPTKFQQMQYLQGQLGPPYVQSQQLQSQIGQSHLPVLEHNQTAQPQRSISQQYIQQPHPQIPENWPSLVELLATESTMPLPYPSEQTNSRLSGQWQSRNQQLQGQPPASYQTEWPQGLNGTLQAGQVPQMTQKGSLRSTSTDSGFTSPLNFNVSTDQTVIDLHEYGITYMDN